MAEFLISRFDMQNDMPPAVAAQLGELFRENYPPYAPAHERAQDVREHAGAAALNKLIIGGSTFYVASAGPSESVDEPPVVGFLESATRTLQDGVFEQLVWIMAALQVRKMGVGRELHQRFIADARKRASERVLPTAALLSVYIDNPALAVYEQWGYAPAGSVMRKPNKVFMRKPLP